MIDLLRFGLLYVVAILVILTFVVTIHELGHFLAARACGVAVDRFSIGFGKALWSRTDKAGVEWRIGWIPLGGYVRFAGDSNDASVPNPEELEGLRSEIEEKLGKDQVARFYHFKPVWQRAIIAAAGPVANFALAVVVFTIVLLIAGERVSPPQVNAVAPGGAAEAAGLKSGDMIERIDGRRMGEFGDIVNYVSMRAGEPMTFDVRRNGQVLALLITPRRTSVKSEVTGYSSKLGQIGISSPPLVHRSYSPPAAVVRSFGMTTDSIGATLTYIRRIVAGRESGDQLSGVIGMANMTGKAIQNSADTSATPLENTLTIGVNILAIMATISVGLGFVNLLPIPVLDGGHLLFYAYEAVARRPAGPRLQAVSYKLGLALVLCLMLFATWNDLQRLQAFKFLGGLFS